MYVRGLNKHLAIIRDHIADQLAAEYDKRKVRISNGGRTANLPREGDLVFFRRIPDAVQCITEGKKSQDDDSVSKRLLSFADPKLYRVSKVTPLGLYHLEDPATGKEVAGFKDPIALDRFTLYGDLPPQEQPLNPNDEVWIEIKSNKVDESGEWLLRKIIFQCDFWRSEDCRQEW